MNRSLWFGVLITTIVLAVSAVFLGFESRILADKDDRLTAVMAQLEPAASAPPAAVNHTQEQSDPKKDAETPSSKKDYPQPAIAGF